MPITPRTPRLSAAPPPLAGSDPHRRAPARPQASDPPELQRLVDRQDGIVARRQLRALGIDSDRVRNQVRARRWAVRSDRTLSTFTGELTERQHLWVAVLHAGGPALVADLTAAEFQGLQHWHRDMRTILVPHGNLPPALPGVQWRQTRRVLRDLRDPTHPLPVCRIEPAVLMFASRQRSHRTANGVLAATVQQGLALPLHLRHWLTVLAPLRGSRRMLATLADIDDGADAQSEIDVTKMCRTFRLPPPDRQRRTTDASGRGRFRDGTWELPDGRLVVLEVLGALHWDLLRWEEDVRRERDLADPRVTVIRATARELREEPEKIAAALIRVGVRPFPTKSDPQQRAPARQRPSNPENEPEAT